MATIISILNYKGGVAKSTTTLNLGTALWLLGKRVLLVDTDVQCNLSRNLDFNYREGDNTLTEWLSDASCNPPVYQHYEGLYFIPASKRLSDIEVHMMNKISRELILRKKLEPISQAFDYILIDCAPKEGLLNTNAMSASDNVLIPSECSGFSMQGMNDMLDSINLVKDNVNEKLDILGFLLVKYDKQTRVSKQVVSYFEKNYPDKIFRTKIRKNVKFDELPFFYQSIFEYSPESNGADDYMALAEEITGEKRPDNWREMAAEAWSKKENEVE